MKYLRFSLVLLLGVMVQYGCLFNPDEPDDNRLFGYWRWVESSGGYFGIHLTPDSVGYTQTYHFTSDSVLYVYRSDTLHAQYRYSIHTTDAETPPTVRDTLCVNDGRPYQTIRYAQSDTLVLSDICMDCFTHRYVKTVPGY